MNVRYIFLLSLISVCCKQSEGNKQYENGIHQAHKGKVPDLPRQVTDTPAVEAARKAHENAYNHTILTQKKYENFLGKLPLKPSNEVNNSKTSPLIQSHVDVEKVRNIPVSWNKMLRVPVINDSIKENKIPTSKPTGSDKHEHEGMTATAIHQQKAAEHLKALRNVIALQLLSYKSSQSTEAPNLHQTPIADMNKSHIVVRKKIKRHNVVHNELNNSMNKKLAVIAAARALIDILDS